MYSRTSFIYKYKTSTPLPPLWNHASFNYILYLLINYVLEYNPPYVQSGCDLSKQLYYNKIFQNYLGTCVVRTERCLNLPKCKCRKILWQEYDKLTSNSKYISFSIALLLNHLVPNTNYSLVHISLVSLCTLLKRLKRLHQNLA